MKQQVETVRLRQLLILAAVFMMTPTAAFARNADTQTSGYIQADKIDTGLSRMHGADPTVEKGDMYLLNELLQPDSASKTEMTAKEELCDSTECVPETPQ